MCGQCLERIRSREAGEPSGLIPLDHSGLETFSRRAAYAGMVLKGAVLIALLLWARRSPAGDAALAGVVIADLFTWAALGALDWYYGRVLFTWSALFEVLVLLLFLNRRALFDVPEAPEMFAVSAGFFFLHALVKTGVWAAETAIETTGVKERASP
ncbi:MAG: hypothetical protein ACYTGN_18260 [Planctomycetota bacterium]